MASESHIRRKMGFFTALDNEISAFFFLLFYFLNQLYELETTA
jgi:hypothetical protein